ncbi:MAG TPA: hypothetical protein VF828_01600 [Patescibacteria group bacterium]
MFGQIAPPLNNQYFANANGGGFFILLSNLFNLAAVIGGIFLIFQIIMAGYGYITAEGDAKKTAAAWNKIWQSILGIVIIASAFLIAGVVERFTGVKILNPCLYGPFGPVCN